MGIEVAVVIQSANQLTARQAAAVLQGVGKVEGARGQLLDVDALGEGAYEWTALDKADAIVFGASTYLGAVPAGFRKLREAVARRRSWKDKLAAGFACTGSPSEEGAGLRQLASIAEQHGMVWVGRGEGDDAEALGLRVAQAALRWKTAH
jgi:NAD(P)H dehydrogenase (quinone)